MKTAFKYVALIAIAFTFLMSCNQSNATKEGSKIGPTPIIDVFECGDAKGVVRYQICEDSASIYMNAYKTYIDTVRGDLAKRYPIKYSDTNTNQKLNYGSATTVLELRGLLRHVNLKDEDKVYFMNGIVKGVTETIMVIESAPRIRSKKNTEDDPTTTYFDFTQACPNSCPTFMN